MLSFLLLIYTMFFAVAVIIIIITIITVTIIITIIIIPNYNIKKRRHFRRLYCIVF